MILGIVRYEETVLIEPITAGLLGGVAGAAAGKFIERAWDSGEKWIITHFRDHQPKAKEEAIENAEDFLRNLGRRVEELEKQGIVSREFLETAQEHPEFSTILQKAMLSAAQTKNKDKHDLLSRVVAERLQTTPESLLSMASKMACDVISYVTPNQLLILGLLTTVYHLAPNSKLRASMAVNWSATQLAPFVKMKIDHLDYVHLEALSCVSGNPLVSRDLAKVLKRNLGDEFDFEAFKSTRVGQEIVQTWDRKELEKYTPTTVGQLLGVMVVDQKTGMKTDLQSWS